MSKRIFVSCRIYKEGLSEKGVVVNFQTQTVFGVLPAYETLEELHAAEGNEAEYIELKLTTV